MGRSRHARFAGDGDGEEKQRHAKQPDVNSDLALYGEQ